MPAKKQEEVVVKTNPDPTEAVKEALELAIKNLDEKISGRFLAIDQATELARDVLNDRLVIMQRTLETSANERALANKDLVDQLAKANQVALTAALQTQKESAAKSELAVGDMLKQLQNSFETSSKATNEKIDRLTSRQDTGEGRIGGVDNNRRDNRDDQRDALSLRGGNVAIISLIMAAVGLFVGWLVGHK